MSLEAKTGFSAAFAAAGQLDYFFLSNNSGPEGVLRSVVAARGRLWSASCRLPIMSWLLSNRSHDFRSRRFRSMVRHGQRALGWERLSRAKPANFRPRVFELLRAAGCAGGCSLLAACAETGPSDSGQVPGNSLAAGASVSDNRTISSGPAIAAPARDGNIAIQEEFDAAVNQNSIDALELFVLRHPEHPLAKDARRRIAALKGEAKGR